MNGFSSLVPGRWSSHPKALKRQRHFFVFMSLLPLLVVVALGIWSFIDCGGWEKLLHPATVSFKGELLWLKLVSVLACATGAAYVTIVLLYGLAMVGDNGDGDDLPFPKWAIALTLFSWVVPIAFWFVRRYFLPPGRFVILNILLNGICLLPVVAIVLWIKAHGEPKKALARRKAKSDAVKPGTMFLLAAVCTLAALYAIMPECPHRFVWGCVWGAVALVLWIKAVVEWARRRKTREPEEPEEDMNEPPPWVAAVRKSLPKGITLEGEIHKESVPDAARLDNNADPVFMLFMDGKTPTVDQSAFFRRFRDAYDEACRKIYDASSPVLGSAGCDLLLTGVEGAGRTESLLAAALYAALVRGDRVLYIVATQKQADSLKKKVDARIAQLLVGDYVATEVLSRSVMAGLIGGGQGGGKAPAILFATPEQVEGNFFDDSSAMGKTSVEAVRCLMLSYGTVLVDDFCEHPLNVRAYLAFLLDKWRFVLANGCVMPQFVVALSPIYRTEGVQELGRRLFGARGFAVDEDIVVLRPRETDPYWFGTVRIGGNLEADKAVKEVIRLCLEEGLKVVYYSRGMTKKEKDEIQKNLEVYDDPLRLLSHIDEMDGADAEADAMLHLSLTSGNAAAAMRLRVGETQAVFLRIVSDSEVEAESTSEQLVPLPDETALSLRVHHLKSVLKFIPTKTPVDVEVWSRFGVSMTADAVRDGRRVSNEAVSARWLYDTWEEKGYGRVAPYLVLENATIAATNRIHVAPGVFPAVAEALWRVDLGNGSKNLLLAKPDEDEPSVGSLVEWRDESGNLLGDSDLSHVERLECKAGSNTFVLNEVRPAEFGDGKHAMVAVGKFSRGSGLDYVFPERRLSWSPACEDACSCKDPSKVGNVASFKLETGSRSGIRISCSFVGVVNSFGRPYECPDCAYDYWAYVSGLVLAPNFSPSDRDETARRLAPLADADVSTDSGAYSPTLTHAFSAAVKHMFDGAAFYAVTPVFWCEGGRASAGKAVVWFVEPVDSGRSLFPLFRKMQNNPAFLKRFFALVREYMEKADTVDKMRAASRLAFKGDALSDSDRSRAMSVLDVLVAENEQVERTETTIRRGDKPPVRKVPSSYTIEDREFDRVVVDALLGFEPEIDVTKFVVEYGWDHDRICDRYFDVLWNNPQVFYVTKRAQCQCSRCGDIVTRFVITDIRYGIAKDEYPRRKAELDEIVDEILAGVDSSMSDVDKARLLHDYIVRVCEYDKVEADRNGGSPLSRTAYGALVLRLAVCEGYTMAYRYLLDKVGIRSEEVLSEKMKHCWNYLNLAGKWYHVDVTWDDPCYAGKDPDKDEISHEFFLLSDSAIQAKQHHDWDVRGLPPADDTTYDGAAWK